MDTYKLIVIFFGLITLLALSILFFINRLFLYANYVEKSFEPIHTYINERIELLRKMKKYVSEQLVHEKSLVKKIDDSITELTSIKNATDGIVKLKKTESKTDIFNKLDELYKKLKDNKDYNFLKEEYQINKERINYAKDKYNEGVKNYNNYKEKKIFELLNKILKFPEFTYYKKEL